MRAFGARGFVSAEKLARDNAYFRQLARDKKAKRRALIAALSNRDISIMMADVIIDATVKRRAVITKDFEDAGLPAHRLEANKAAALRIARRKEPRLDAMLDGGVAA